MHLLGCLTSEDESEREIYIKMYKGNKIFKDYILFLLVVTGAGDGIGRAYSLEVVNMYFMTKYFGLR